MNVTCESGNLIYADTPCSECGAKMNESCRGQKAAKERADMRRAAAAAPDLLAALEEVVRISDRKHDAWDAAKAAIKKARGE